MRVEYIEEYGNDQRQIFFAFFFFHFFQSKRRDEAGDMQEVRCKHKMQKGGEKAKAKGAMHQYHDQSINQPTSSTHVAVCEERVLLF